MPYDQHDLRFGLDEVFHRVASGLWNSVRMPQFCSDCNTQSRILIVGADVTIAVQVGVAAKHSGGIGKLQ